MYKKTLMLLLFVSLSTPALAQEAHWTHIYGGSESEAALDIKQTEDGGYIVAGHTGSFGAGEDDLWILRMDADGDTLWARTYGDSDCDWGTSVLQDTDGHFVVTGYTGARDNFYDADLWLLKIDDNGDTLWTNSFGGPGDQRGRCVIQTAEGGYLIVGYTGSQFASYDTRVYLVKTYSDGSLEWSNTLGSADHGVRGYGVRQTPDGGFIVVGVTDFSIPGGDPDVFLLKADVNGDSVWVRSYGELFADEWAWSVDLTPDAGFIIAAENGHVWLLRADSNGDTLWTRTYGGGSEDIGYSVRRTADDGYIVCGSTKSFGAGYDDAWLIRTDSNGDTLWARTYGGSEWEWAFSVDQTADGWFVFAGCTVRDANHDAYIVKVGPPTAHHVASCSPEQNDLDVPSRADISVTFDVDMDPTTINSTTFVVNSSVTGRHSGTITYDPATRTATFDPDQDFDVGETVTVVLTTGIETAEGVALGRSYVFSFTTAVEDGSGVFYPDASYEAGEGPVSIFAADMDGDGDPDLVAGGSRYIWVLFNDGEGAFPTCWWELVQDWRIRAIGGGDLDGDGDIDVATDAMDDSIVVLMNAGDGTLSPYSSSPLEFLVRTITVADLDGDGDLDLATSNDFGNCVSVQLNQGDGTFDLPSFYLTGYRTTSAFAADFDNDGDLDLLAANDLADSISILMNNWDGTFVKDADYSSEGVPSTACAADLDGDGDADVVVVNGASDDVSVRLNNGDGTLATETRYPVGDGPVPAFPGDLNGDGYPDLAVVNTFGNDVSILLNNTDGTFTPDSTYPAESHAWAIAEADFNGDGTLDIAIANETEPSVLVLLNVYFGDANGDGVINVADIVYSVNFLYRGGDPPYPIDSADANCDGVVNVADVVHLVNYLYRQGPAPGC